MTPEQRAASLVGACTHVSQWSESSLVACESCISQAIRSAEDDARQQEREECAAALCILCARGNPLDEDGDHIYAGIDVRGHCMARKIRARGTRATKEDM